MHEYGRWYCMCAPRGPCIQGSQGRVARVTEDERHRVLGAKSSGSLRLQILNGRCPYRRYGLSIEIIKCHQRTLRHDGHGERRHGVPLVSSRRQRWLSSRRGSAAQKWVAILEAVLTSTAAPSLHLLGQFVKGLPGLHVSRPI